MLKSHKIVLHQYKLNQLIKQKTYYIKNFFSFIDATKNIRIKGKVTLRQMLSARAIIKRLSVETAVVVEI